MKILYTLPLFIILFSCSGEKKNTPVDHVIPFVRVQEVQPSEQSVSRQFSGVTAAEEELVLAYRIPGIIQSLSAREGSKVTSGAVISTLDPEEYELEQLRSRAAWESAKVQAAASEASYKRIRELYQNDSASRNQLEAALSAYEAADSSLVAAKAQMDRADIQLSYTKIKAPIDGEVTQVLADPGEVVAAGQGVALFSSNRVNLIRFSVSEEVIPQLSRGMTGTVSIPSAGKEQVSGTITEISSGSSQSGSLYPVKMEIDTILPDIRPGMACTVSLTLDRRDRQIFHVPPHTVMEDHNGRYAYIAVESPGTDSSLVKRVAVQTGNLDDEGLEVLDGLNRGDMLITAGMSRLRDGMDVRLPRELN